MHPFVNVEMRGCLKSFSTHITWVRSFIRVNYPLVLRHSFLWSEARATNIALKKGKKQSTNLHATACECRVEKLSWKFCHNDHMNGVYCRSELSFCVGSFVSWKQSKSHKYHTKWRVYFAYFKLAHLWEILEEL